MFYKIYYKKELRRSCSDIALGFDDSNGRIIENFKTPPNLTTHGLNGIIIAGGAQFGSNVTISQQVTVGRSRGGAPIIGDNVYIGPGAKIFGAIRIGNNVNIGANCVVFEDIPKNSTVVLDKPRIILGIRRVLITLLSQMKDFVLAGNNHSGALLALFLNGGSNARPSVSDCRPF